MATYRTADATVSIHSAAQVDPSDSEVFPICRALWIGGGGDVTVDLAGRGENITFRNVPGGTFLEVQVTRVYANGTNASDILRCW